MKRNVLITVAIVGMLVSIIVGCDIGINPLILDGSVTVQTFYVNTTGLSPSFDNMASFDITSLGNLTSYTIDSLKFYNLTILIDSAGGTPPGTKISGNIIIDEVNGIPAADTIAVLDSAQVTDFSSERSIFDPTLSSVAYNTAGITNLKNNFNNGAIMRVHVKGGSNASPLVFDIHIKIYGQLYTNPKK